MARLTKSMVQRVATTAGRFAPVAAAACLLSACVDLPSLVFSPPPVDLTSPIAKDVDAASKANKPYPRFADVPPGAPTDIRPPSAWSRNIYDTLRLRREQEVLESLYPQTLSGTEAWADMEKARAVPPPPPGGSQTEDYAKTQRDRAKPPSPAS